MVKFNQFNMKQNQFRKSNIEYAQALSERVTVERCIYNILQYVGRINLCQSLSCLDNLSTKINHCLNKPQNIHTFDHSIQNEIMLEQPQAILLLTFSQLIICIFRIKQLTYYSMVYNTQKLCTVLWLFLCKHRYLSFRKL